EFVRQQPCQTTLNTCDGPVVRWIMWHLVDEVSFQEFQAVVFREKTKLDEAMILVHGETMKRSDVPRKRAVQYGGDNHTLFRHCMTPSMPDVLRIQRTGPVHVVG